MSGVQAIAPRWPARRARFLFREINERGYDLPLASVTRDGGVEFRADLDTSVWNPGDDVSGYKRVRPGDFVIGLRSFQSGLGCSPLEGLVSPAYSVLRPSRDDMDTGYFRHLFKSDVLVSLLDNIARGIRQGRTIAVEDFNELCLPVPPALTQRVIADYLDRETARIDALIAAKRRMVELLEERWRRALDNIIWGAVAPRVSLRRVTTFIDYRGATPTKQGHGVPLVTASHIKKGVIAHSVEPQFISESRYGDWMRRGLPAAGDVVMTTEAPLGEVAQIDDPGVALAQRLILLKAASGELHADFLALALRSMQFQAQLRANATGSTALGIKADRLKGLVVPTPSIESQRGIVAELTVLDNSRSLTVDALDHQVNLLKERRQALVTEAVTGQLDISDPT
jgi:type I restriction enzyme S subunit